VAKYRPKYHTSSKELPEIANRARPKLLILYHQGYGVGGLSSEEDLIKEMRAADKGDFVSGYDLDMFGRLVQGFPGATRQDRRPENIGFRYESSFPMSVPSGVSRGETPRVADHCFRLDVARMRCDCLALCSSAGVREKKDPRPITAGLELDGRNTLKNQGVTGGRGFPAGFEPVFAVRHALS
jgi:hypothetical protein